MAARSNPSASSSGPKSDSASALYKPLGRKEHNFRLLRLLPGRPSQPISCELYAEPLKRGKKYEALSYVWGDPTIIKEISVNGHPFQATENLYHALRRLRKPKEARIIWVDAICINQKDDSEKGFQVDLMSRIYTFASGVVIWLGNVPSKYEASCIGAFNRIRSRAEGKLPEGQGCATKEGLYRCYERMLFSPWFTRSWTVQEAILAKNLTVMLGPGYCSFESVLQAESGLWRTLRDANVRILPNTYSEIANMRKQRRRPNGKGLTLLSAIRQYWDRQATDPRDKIFAFLGIINDWQGFKEVGSDYTLNADGVFAKATFEIAKRQRSIELLSLVVLNPNHESDKPSWVPPFSRATLKAAQKDFNSRPVNDLRLYDKTILSLNGRYLEKLEIVAVESKLKDIRLVDADKIYRTALDTVTQCEGLQDFITAFDRLRRSDELRAKPELAALNKLPSEFKELLRKESHLVLQSDVERDSLAAPLHRLWRVFTEELSVCAKELQLTGETATTEALGAILKRWLCWRANESGYGGTNNRRVKAQSGASMYVGAFGEHMDNFEIDLLLRDDKAPLDYEDQYAFATESGHIGFAPPLAKGDELWALEEKEAPFVLRPRGEKKLMIAGEEKMVQTHWLVGRCISVYHPDQFEYLGEPRKGVWEGDEEERRVYLC